MTTAARTLPLLGPGADAPFPPPERAWRRPNGLLAAGGGLEPRRLINAYRHGIFPWYMPGEPILWWCPDPRCVFDTAAPHVSTRLRRWLRGSRWRVEADGDFAAVIDGCARGRDVDGGTWITPDMRRAYLALHRLGVAHAIEVRDGERLVGGLYGVALGRMFFAESMFSAATNGSKIALLGLCRRLAEWGFPRIDAQVPNPHLFTLGARLMERAAFLREVTALAAMDEPAGSWHQRFGTLAASALA